MSKVTSKLQVTIPKAVADEHHIAPGDELAWISSGTSIHVVREPEPGRHETVAGRLRLFDRATQRQAERNSRAAASARATKRKDRGWTRDELYDRDRAR